MLKNKKRAGEAKREMNIENIKKYWKILLVILIALVLIISFGTWSERNDKTDSNKLEINSSSDEFNGRT